MVVVVVVDDDDDATFSRRVGGHRHRTSRGWPKRFTRNTSENTPAIRTSKGGSSITRARRPRIVQDTPSTKAGCRRNTSAREVLAATLHTPRKLLRNVPLGRNVRARVGTRTPTTRFGKQTKQNKNLDV